jgi:hypothetical protein
MLLNSATQPRQKSNQIEINTRKHTEQVVSGAQKAGNALTAEQIVEKA